MAAAVTIAASFLMAAWVAEMPTVVMEVRYDSGGVMPTVMASAIVAQVH